MRAIKFRAWDKVSKQMFNVYSIEFKKDGVWACLDWESKVTGIRENWLSPDRLELMQYTGLKDKNGVEIFEGDIVKYNKMIQGATPVWSNPVVVEWRSDKAKFDFHDDYSDGWSFNGFIYIDYEVIGNIYETPELLEDKK